MGGQVWKIINVVGPRVVNGLNVAGYGRSEPEKSWPVLSLGRRLSLRSGSALNAGKQGKQGEDFPYASDLH